MLKLTVIQGGHVMMSEAARSRVKFPTDKEIGQIFHTICPNAEIEVTQRHPASIILRLSAGVSDVDRARLLDRMEDRVSRTQLTAA